MKMRKEEGQEASICILPQSLKVWEEATDALANTFIRKYFDDDASCFWVGDEIGGMLAVNDYFFSLDRILEALRYAASDEQLFGYCELELEAAMEEKEVGISFRNYLRQEI